MPTPKRQAKKNVRKSKKKVKKAERDYKAEYRKFHKSKKAKKKRASCNAGRKKLGLKKGDKRDAAHTKNGIVAKLRSKNRGSSSDQPGDRKARGKGVKKNQPKRKRTTKKK